MPNIQYEYECTQTKRTATEEFLGSAHILDETSFICYS